MKSAVASLVASLWVAATVPTFAQERSIVLDDLTSLRDFAAPYSALALSSDGSRLAFVTRTADLARNTYEHEVYVVETRAPFHARAVARAGDSIPLSLRGRRGGLMVQRIALWSPDNRWLAYLVGQEGYAELWRVRSGGGAPQRVSIAGQHVVDFSWTINGDLTYRAAISSEERTAQLSDAAFYGFHADDRFEPIYDVAPRIDDSTPVTAWQVNLRTGRRTSIDVEVRAGAEADVRVVPADARFADAESPELALEASYRGEVRRCSVELCSGELLAAWAGEDETVVFLRQTGHHGALSQLAIWSLQDNRVRSILVSEQRLSACTRDRGHVYCLEDASAQPQRLISIASANGAVQVVWDPNPSWASMTVPRIERLDATNPGGEQSFAHLVYPADYMSGRRYPLVIVQYRSRGFLRGGSGGEHPIFPLSTLGYFVLSVDRPEAFSRSRTLSSSALLVASELDGSEHAMKAIALEHFINELDRRGLIDPNRIGITGMSDGAETLFHMLLTSERRFAAAVSSSAPPDPSTWAIQSREFRERRARFGAVAPWSETDNAWTAYWRRLSPIYHLDRMTTPILFNLAETETLPAMPLVARLQEIGAAHDLYVYPGAYHNKWRPLQIRAAQMRAIAWLDLWLRDLDTPDTQETDRAARWRRLRDAASSSTQP